MHSHLVELDVSVFVLVFLYFHTLYMREAKAPARLRGSSELSLLPDVITTKFCVLANIVFGSYFFGVSIDISMALGRF